MSAPKSPCVPAEKSVATTDSERSSLSPGATRLDFSNSTVEHKGMQDSDTGYRESAPVRLSKKCPEPGGRARTVARTVA